MFIPSSTIQLDNSMPHHSSQDAGIRHVIRSDTDELERDTVNDSTDLCGVHFMVGVGNQCSPGFTHWDLGSLVGGTR